MHPARAMTYVDLVTALQAEERAGNVVVQSDGDLRLFTYSRSCAYDRAWNPINELARGLIIDSFEGRVIATPFPKFFNHGERPESIPDLPFDTFEKVDGSLIIIFWHGGKWRTATKGSFRSEQAAAAAAFLTPSVADCLTPGWTYLAEYVGPTNRIVVPYDAHELILLSAYDSNGMEITRIALKSLGNAMGWRCAARHEYSSIADLLATAGRLPATAEGFVIRFINGHRIKIKGDEYCRLHRMVSNVSPLAIYESMKAGDDLDAIRRDLPEEFWGDFDSIRTLLRERIHRIVDKTIMKCAEFVDMSDKDVGLCLHDVDEDIRSFIFPLRKHGDLLAGKARESLFRAIRPTANRLDGYVPSSSMNRVFEEAA